MHECRLFILRAFHASSAILPRAHFVNKIFKIYDLKTYTIFSKYWERKERSEEWQFLQFHTSCRGDRIGQPVRLFYDLPRDIIGMQLTSSSNRGPVTIEGELQKFNYTTFQLCNYLFTKLQIGRVFPILISQSSASTISGCRWSSVSIANWRITWTKPYTFQVQTGKYTITETYTDQTHICEQFVKRVKQKFYF